MTMANEYTSLASEKTFSSKNSGAMKAGVPTCPLPIVEVAEVFNSSHLDKPKSAPFARPSCVSSTFADLRSRCSTPCEYR